eukprot:TRINITY_DN24560_c0_g1_i1.p1 TRINITY_DN24560_c0_g1~~TRINITY_DN24560_c0_g1_i1.p1  ORF type:complete len:491 (+),score=230.03 TRINITY_DN24560_c0_g1_i1:69-1475(+)
MQKISVGALRAARAYSTAAPAGGPPSGAAKEGEKKEAEAAPQPAEADASGSGQKGLFSSVMASMMKTDVRAAYECSLLPPEKQQDFLTHVRNSDEAARKHELEKLKEHGKSELEVAKVKAAAALDEMRSRKAAEEEADAARHLRELELLDKQIASANSLARSKYRHQKWKAVSERERRKTMQEEDRVRSKDHQYVLQKLEKEYELRRRQNEELLQTETARHKLLMEQEAAKLSFAESRLKENVAAIELAPENKALKEKREHEVVLETERSAERARQREHEWELHAARLEAAQRDAEAQGNDTGGQQKTELITRLGQILVAGIAVGAAYDWERRKMDDKAAERDADARRAALAAESEKDRHAAELELARANESARVAANLEKERIKAQVAAEEVNKARLALDAATAQANAAMEAKLAAEIELETAEANIKNNHIMNERMEQVRKYLSSALGVSLAFGLMFKLGSMSSRD